LDSKENSRLVLDDNQIAMNLYGEKGSNLKKISSELNVKINARGNELTIFGKERDVIIANKVLRELYDLISDGYKFNQRDIDQAIDIIKSDPSARISDVFLKKVPVSGGKKILSPKTINQKKYLDAIQTNDILFGIGPAGTGKTYLAMAMAVSAFVNNEVKRIILTRPAVEAGEKLGFLPGDLAEKINPYLRPLYDALYDMLPFEKVANLMERQVIEIAPLAFMRGRTLNEAFIILDEAQNTTSEQMKMFLTRMGFNSKVIVTGDITQIDLPDKSSSGLIEATRILKDIDGISFVFFNQNDVIRHKLIKLIIDAYEKHEDKMPLTGRNKRKIEETDTK